MKTATLDRSHDRPADTRQGTTMQAITQDDYGEAGDVLRLEEIDRPAIGEGEVLTASAAGYGKRTPADEYRLTNRGGKGVINVKTTERVGKVVGIAQVDETSEVMLISHYGKIIRMDSSTIRESGRAAQGVRLLQLEPGDRVAAAVVIPLEEAPNGGLIQ